MKNKVAIIGVGTQGSMIAFRNAVYGKEVTAYSRNLSSRERCAERIERFLEFYVQTGRLMQAEAAFTRGQLDDAMIALERTYAQTDGSGQENIALCCDFLSLRLSLFDQGTPPPLYAAGAL